MRSTLITTLAACFLTLSGTGLVAQTLTYEVELTGTQEVPAVATTGLGVATVTLDPNTGAVSVSGSYSNTSGPVVAAHLHGAARRGANSGVVLGLQQTGGTAGTFSGRGILSATQIQDLRAGLTYLNVHSQANPGGEVRGQIDSVPGSGTAPSAPPVTIDGAATAGGTLTFACPPGLGAFFMLLGVPSPGIALPMSVACASPTVVAVDFSVPVVAVQGPSFSLPIPAAVGVTTLAMQCGQFDLNRNCVALSAAHHIAIRP